MGAARPVKPRPRILRMKSESGKVFESAVVAQHCEPSAGHALASLT
jgi:hypothetical protein